MSKSAFVGSLDVRIFSGYVWYAYPLNAGMLLDYRDIFDVAPVAWLPMKNWDSRYKEFGNYSENGVIFVTRQDTIPKVPEGWEVTPCAVPEGFGYYDPQLYWKFRHVHTAKHWDFDEKGNGERTIYSIFVGVDVG